MRMVDYLVEVDGDESTGIMEYNVRSALAKGKKMAKEHNKTVYVYKFKYDGTWGMVPADFDFPSYWIIEPNGEISEH